MPSICPLQSLSDHREFQQQRRVDSGFQSHNLSMLNGSQFGSRKTARWAHARGLGITAAIPIAIKVFVPNLARKASGSLSSQSPGWRGNVAGRLGATHYRLCRRCSRRRRYP
ncbi:MAG: hypothetical protein R2788_01945 [Saprospiraceae bacterium]